METVSKTKVNLKKGNKENTRPASGLTKTLKKGDVSKTVTTSSAALHSKVDEKEIIMGQEADVVKKVKTGQKDAKSRHTLSQAFLSRQAVRERKLITEAPKLQASVPPKPVLGTYKGRVVQSKIGSIWKSSCSLDGGENKASTKPSVPKVETQKTVHLTKVKSRSIADLHGRGTLKPPQSQLSKAKSVSDGPNPVSKRPASSVPVAPRPAGPPARHASSGSLDRGGSTKPAMISKRTELQSTKPKMPVGNQKVNKPAVSSSLSQYRVHTETTEERRAKLAEWLASKGKTLKRPPMTSAAPPVTREAEVTEVQAPSQIIPEPESSDEPEAPAQTGTEPQPGLEAPETTTAPPPDRNQEPQLLETACASSPLIMNTTLDLLDNSDMDLPVDPEVRINDVVVNLCDVLAAMVTPSQCVDEPQETQGEFEEGVGSDEADKKENERPETVSDDVDSEDDVKSEAEEKTSNKMNQSCSEEEEEEPDSDVTTSITPETEGASVVKYSVRTTPYLQSVKKTMEGEARASGSSRKSTIKDLKFLTPVRRSCRIQRKSSRLPGMLTDHDPCVSSLAELVQLDDDANAYIYRKNPALLEELPDHPRDLGKI